MTITKMELIWCREVGSPFSLSNLRPSMMVYKILCESRIQQLKKNPKNNNIIASVSGQSSHVTGESTTRDVPTLTPCAELL